MAIAAGLDNNPRSGLMPQVLPHHSRGTAQESEWTCQHSLIANRNQLWNPSTITCRQDCHRVAINGPAQISVMLTRRFSAQANAMIVALGKRARRCRSHCDLSKYG